MKRVHVRLEDDVLEYWQTQAKLSELPMPTELTRHLSRVARRATAEPPCSGSGAPPWSPEPPHGGSWDQAQEPPRSHRRATAGPPCGGSGDPHIPPPPGDSNEEEEYRGLLAEIRAAGGEFLTTDWEVSFCRNVEADLAGGIGIWGKQPLHLRRLARKVRERVRDGRTRQSITEEAAEPSSPSWVPSLKAQLAKAEEDLAHARLLEEENPGEEKFRERVVRFEGKVSDLAEKLNGAT